MNGSSAHTSTTSKRRILGSPFKSPEHVSNNASQNLFPAKPRGNGFLNNSETLSPTPNRLKNKDKRLQIDEAIQEEDSAEDSASQVTSTIVSNENGDHKKLSPSSSPAQKHMIASITPVKFEITCPICNEKMITLSQLNQHIDDVHSLQDDDSDVPQTADSTSKAPISNSSFDLPKLINNEFIGKDIKKWFSAGRGNSNDSQQQQQQHLHQSPPRHQPDRVTSPSRKTVNLDLLDDNKGFSLRDTNASTDELDHQSTSTTNNSRNSNRNVPRSLKTNTPRISRTHWKQPSSSSTNNCSYQNCGKVLNVKNGIVNCRRCGDLFCNKHTYYKVRLQNSNNGSRPNYEPSQHGVWSRCCKNCYLNKPDLQKGTDVGSNDLSDIFLKKRRSTLDERQMTRGRLQKKFIRLVNLMADNYLYHTNHHNNRFNVLSVFKTWDLEGDGPFTKSQVLDQQKLIVGEDNWGHDETATHCTICFSRFNLLIRKHHCRLCGQVVCDDSYGERKNCSIVVPLSKLIEKQENFNYSLQVRSNWQQLVNVDSHDANIGQFSVRCCKICKDDVLYEWRLDNLKNGISIEDDNLQMQIFQKYDEMLLIKSNLMRILPRYKQLIDADEYDEHDEINRLRIKAMHCLKDFEDAIGRFKRQFFSHDESAGKFVVNNSFEEYSHFINNITNSSLIYLQEQLLEYKDLSQAFQKRENQILANDKRKEKEKLAGRLLSPPPIDDRLRHSTPTPVIMTPTPEPDELSNNLQPPTLTKKQIRELREQLMVMKEQKFMIGNMIDDTKKQRRFDELDPLIGNQKELTNTIESLEAQLGDFGF